MRPPRSITVGGPARLPLGELLRRLLEEVRGLAAAYLAYGKLEVTRRLRAGLAAAAFGIAALAIASAATTALLVGLILWVGTLLGSFGWGTLIVIGGAMAVAVVLGLLAARAVGRAIDPDGATRDRAAR